MNIKTFLFVSVFIFCGWSQCAFAQGIFYENLIIHDPRGFPVGTTLKIQRLSFFLNSLSPSGLNVVIDNGRINMPLSDPVVFDGDITNGQININMYSKSVELKEILSLFPGRPDWNILSGTLENVDWYLRGLLTNPSISGTFNVNRVQHEAFVLNESSGNIDVSIKEIDDVTHWKGHLFFQQGQVISKQSPTVINVDPSEFLFGGVFRDTNFDLHGHTKIGETTVNLSLKGTKDATELKVTSDPPFAQRDLLVMLATGKSWGATAPVNSDIKLSNELTQDFLDYFLFAGEAGRLSQRLGIKDVVFQYNSQVKGIGLKKDITNRADIGYGIEESLDANNQTTTVTQKLEGEYSLTDHISIDVERKIKEERQEDQIIKPPKSDDQILLKYKKKF